MTASPPAPPRLVANSRMYNVSKSATAAWTTLFHHVAARSSIPLEVVEHAFPADLPALYHRTDIACAFMCGLPFIRGRADVVPVVAPLPDDPRGAGRPVYWTDIVVRADDPVPSLAEATGGVLAWTAEESQSGYHALFRHLDQHGVAFARQLGQLTTPRRVMEAVVRGDADVGPLDSFAHALLRRHEPALASRVKVLARTEPTPCPLLVASRSVPGAVVQRVTDAFVNLASAAPASLLSDLCLAGFVPPLSMNAYRAMMPSNG